jgi:hypothetical protein
LHLQETTRQFATTVCFTYDQTFDAEVDLNFQTYQFSKCFMLTIPLAIVAHLAVEMPTMELDRLFLRQLMTTPRVNLPLSKEDENANRTLLEMEMKKISMK